MTDWKTIFSKPYNPKSTETRIYENWENTGYFSPKIDKSKDPFVMIMPPPNVTGQLHMGHALTIALEDMIVRWHRMNGEPTLYLPGTDHAGIATQVVVERLLASEGTNRYELGREQFEQRIWEWVHEYGERIYTQIRRLGASCDWSRKSFTLDDGPKKAVRKTFVDLYNKNLIYRGERITNWCPRCSTALSDLEVKYKNVAGQISKIKYPLSDNSTELIVATTRPETMMGDTAVAVNPNDDRFSHLIGKQVILPLMNKTIPIIGDSAVEIEFGTGALKVTPAHDPVAFEIGIRQAHPSISVISKNCVMNENAGIFEGLTREECRIQVLESLESQGYLVESEEYDHSVGHCDRCDEIIEPLISKQWYVSIEELAKPARDAVREGKIKIVPERFTNVYFNWMDNIRDWSVSRQLWWGHQIPVWYCNDCNEMIVEYEDPIKCKKCPSGSLIQDPDVLDTWFSSGLWPHSTLGWPDSTEDLEYFYPGSVLETGYDILFFWVARMIMMGIQNMGEIPFHTIYLHGLILDPEGIKMSKTKGNVVDPLELIDSYGADAVRFALTTGTSAGNNVRINEQKLESSRNFNNKLWNAARFVLAYLDNEKHIPDYPVSKDLIHLHDQWIIDRLNQVTNEINQLMENHQFGEAQTTAHDFFWNEFCDWYIELVKLRVKFNESSRDALNTISYTLEQTLRLLHPFIPFITEEIWSILINKFDSTEKWPSALIEAPYPKFNHKTSPKPSIMNEFFQLVRSIRNLRAEFKVPATQLIDCEISSSNRTKLFESQKEFIKELSGLGQLSIYPNNDQINSQQKISIVLENAIAYIDLGTSLNVSDEISRLNQEKTQIHSHINSLSKRLSNKEFIDKAPSEIIDKERDRLKSAEDRAKRIDEILLSISN
ncbi:MAG: valine--tRNA ligase [SAR202 cluster bacterium]|nr:valine--tRNA ligase [SAR202 cluster bacterium]